jgi:hypothetical protein
VAGQLPVYCNVVVEVKGVSGGYLKPSSCKEMQDELFKDPSRFITSPSIIPNDIAATESELEDLEEEVESESLADDPSNKKLRPQEKSDDYYSRIIECYSKSGDLVFDGFAGTFSCGVSCVKLHRKFIGVERDPEVFKPAVARLFSEFAGTAKEIPLVNNKACAGCALFKELSQGFCSDECKEAYDLNVKAAQASIENGNFLTQGYLFTPLPTHVVRTAKSNGWSDADINSLFTYPVSHFCLLESVSRSAAIPEELIQKDRLEQLFKAESNFYSGNFEVKSSKLDGSGVFAAKDLKKGSIIGILFGRYCWMSSIVARRTECTEEQLKQGLRHRVMDISEEFNMIESFPLVGQLKKLIDKRNSEIVEERSDVPFHPFILNFLI